MGKRGRILVVDDDEGCCEMLGEILRREGFDVDLALGGEEALDRIREQRPDVVVSDIYMPLVDGFALLAHLREWLPVILMSGDRSKEVAVMSAGAVGYLIKPLDTSTLFRTIDLALGRA